MNLPLPETKCRLCGNHGALEKGFCEKCIIEIRETMPPEQPTPRPSPIDRFKTLAEEARPMQDRLTEIAYEQMQLSHQASVEMLREAFPNATFRNVNPLGEIKPTEMSKRTHDIITALKAAGIEPTEMLIDDRRKIITLAR